MPAAAAWRRSSDLVPIAIVVCVLLAIVVTSYRQTIYAYPQRRRLLRRLAARTSGRCLRSSPGASLLVDYVLTVAVSVSAGVAAITSAFPGCAPDARRALPLVHRR